MPDDVTYNHNNIISEVDKFIVSTEIKSQQLFLYDFLSSLKIICSFEFTVKIASCFKLNTSIFIEVYKNTTSKPRRKEKKRSLHDVINLRHKRCNKQRILTFRYIDAIPNFIFISRDV